MIGWYRNIIDRIDFLFTHLSSVSFNFLQRPLFRSSSKNMSIYIHIYCIVAIIKRSFFFESFIRIKSHFLLRCARGYQGTCMYFVCISRTTNGPQQRRKLRCGATTDRQVGRLWAHAIVATILKNCRSTFTWEHFHGR